MVSRRNLLKYSAGAAGVAAFNPVSRAWAHGGGNGLAKLPKLDGDVVMDSASLAAASQDAGHVLPRTPWAVLRPGSVKDVQKMVDFCKKHRIFVSARGQGHTTDGQALNAGGLVIETKFLGTVHSIAGGFADVDAGVKWSDLIPQTLAVGFRPPVLTGYVGLSVGGTLSVGGISSSFSAGPQVDTVEELHVVNGRGDLIRCNRTHHAPLFHAVLGGLGQCGIIVRAKLRLVPAQELTRVYTLNYADPAAFFADLRVLLQREELDDAFNFGLPDGAGGWVYQLTLAKYFTPGTPPNDAHLLRGLSGAGTDLVAQDIPFVHYAFRVDVVIEFFRSLGLWEGVMHPWFDVFLPDETVEEYVTSVTASLTPDDVGPTGFLLMFPQKRSTFGTGVLQVPNNTEWVYLYDILTAAPMPGFDPAYDAQMRARNRALFDQAEAVGGKRYPIGTMEFDRSDWKRHFGHAYNYLRVLKHFHDPEGILTPGPEIFRTT